MGTPGKPTGMHALESLCLDVKQIWAFRAARNTSHIAARRLGKHCGGWQLRRSMPGKEFHRERFDVLNISHASWSIALIVSVSPHSRFAARATRRMTTDAERTDGLVIKQVRSAGNVTPGVHDSIRCINVCCTSWDSAKIVSGAALPGGGDEALIRGRHRPGSQCCAADGGARTASHFWNTSCGRNRDLTSPCSGG